MRPSEIESFERYQQIVAEYGGKGCLTNEYLQWEASDLIIHDVLYAYCGKRNAFLFVRKDGFWRMYYYLNDLTETVDFGSEEMVTEILFRGNQGEPADEIGYLEQCGFKRNLVRDQYSAIYSKLTQPVFISGLSISDACFIEEAEWAVNLFNASFDKWSGDFVPQSQAQYLLQEKAILIAKDANGALLGALHLERKNGVMWLNHVAVIQQSRGMGVGLGLVEAYIERGHQDDKSRYTLWVQRQNTPAVSLYQKKGFSYINKSTLSMIKL